MIECREYPRIPVDMQVLFSSTNKTDIRQGTMFDLSARGCAVTSMSSVQPGSAVRILIRSTDLGSPITIESAAVRWSQSGEFGVEFLDLSEIDQRRLHRLLRSHHQAFAPVDPLTDSQIQRGTMPGMTCPLCHQPSTWEGNPWRPFCSERCQVTDLGAWATERLSYTGPHPHDGYFAP